MRRILFGIIVVCILYFVGGGVLASIGYIDYAKFSATLGVAGGIASIAGLLTFFQPRLTPEDLQAVDGDSLRRISQLAAELSERNEQVSAKRQEIASLEQQKRELELLVRRASAGLFLESRIRMTRERLLQIVLENAELRTLLADSATLQRQLADLEIEIESDPNVDLLNEIMATARSENRLLDTLPEPYRGILRIAEQVLRAASGLYLRL